MALVRFEATKLVNKGKKGILKPDSNGYYKIVVGGLNAVNSAGHWYSDAARYLFTGVDGKSILQRRIREGNLKGEAGHPKPLPGMTNDDFKYRLLSVEEKCVSHHIRSIELDDEFGKNHPEYGNPNLIAIIAEIKPTGPFASGLQMAFDNPDENVCFSIRGFTDDTIRGGKRIRTLFEVVTFDWVTEPGIATSTKWDSPACESASIETFMDIPLSRNDLEKMVKTHGNNALESDTNRLVKHLLNHGDGSIMSSKDVRPMGISRW